MSFLAPLSALLGLLAIPIILLYMLRLRRRDQVVSSTFLWQMVLQDREANRPWQKLRRNWLLLLQLLLLAAMVLALTRPFLPIPTVANGNLVLLLDGSASMLATDVKPTRFEVARQAAQNIINNLPEESSLTLILVSRQPQILATASRNTAELSRALQSANATQGNADWSAALALANGSASNQAETTVVLISDGGLPTNVNTVNGNVRYIPIGQSAENLAIRALAVRANANGEPQLFVSVHNYGTQPHDITLSIYINNQLFHARQLSVPATENSDLSLPVWADTVSIFAELTPVSGSGSVDALASDDRAWSVYQPTQSGRMLFVAPKGNLFIEQALAALPSVRAFKQSAELALPQEAFDLYFFESNAPSTLPPASMVLLNPGENAWFDVLGEVLPNANPVWQVESHPTNRYVDWSAMQIDSLQPLKPKATYQTQFQPIVSVGGVPLVWAGEVENRRILAVGFDLRRSDFALQVGFPIWMANALAWLHPSTVIQTSGDFISPGDSVTILPDLAAEQVYILAPDGIIHQAPATEQGVVFADTEILGLYAVLSNNSNQERVVAGGYFAVNSYSALESDISPRATVRLAQQTVSQGQPNAIGQQELWRWAVWLAIGVIGLESWVYYRGRTH
jgi:hypothetical protein